MAMNVCFCYHHKTSVGLNRITMLNNAGNNDVGKPEACPPETKCRKKERSGKEGLSKFLFSSQL